MKKISEISFLIFFNNDFFLKNKDFCSRKNGGNFTINFTVLIKKYCCESGLTGLKRRLKITTIVDHTLCFPPILLFALLPLLTESWPS